MAAGAAAGGFLAGVIIGRNIASLEEGLAKAPDAWKPLCQKGLELTTENGRPVLTGTVRGVRCKVSVITDVVKYAHTRVTAEASQRVEASVSVYPSPAGVLSKLRSLLAQDIEIGDPTFDQEFLIQAQPKQVAASLLSTESRQCLTALAGGRLSAFSYEPGEASVQLHGVELDSAMIEAAVELVVAAARWTL